MKANLQRFPLFHIHHRQRDGRSSKLHSDRPSSQEFAGDNENVPKKNIQWVEQLCTCVFYFVHFPSSKQQNKNNVKTTNFA